MPGNFILVLQFDRHWIKGKQMVFSENKCSLLHLHHIYVKEINEQSISNQNEIQ